MSVPPLFPCHPSQVSKPKPFKNGHPYMRELKKQQDRETNGHNKVFQWSDGFEPSWDELGFNSSFLICLLMINRLFTMKRKTLKINKTYRKNRFPP